MYSQSVMECGATAAPNATMDDLGTENPDNVASDLAALAQLARTAYAKALCEQHAARVRAAPAAKSVPAPAAAAAPAREPPAPPRPAQPTPPTPPPPPATDRFDEYSWDQSDKYVTLYVPVDGATAAETTHDIGARSFALAHARDGKTRRLAVPNLCGPVDAPRGAETKGAFDFHAVGATRRATRRPRRPPGAN